MSIIKRAIAYLFQFPYFATWAKHDARGLATISQFMQGHYIGANRYFAKEDIQKSWSSCETGEISDDKFLVKNDSVLEGFIFHFNISGGIDGHVSMIAGTSANYPNIIICIDEQARNFVIRDESKSLTYAEKKLCEQLLKTGVFLKGRTN